MAETKEKEPVGKFEIEDIGYCLKRDICPCRCGAMFWDTTTTRLCTECGFKTSLTKAYTDNRE
jgi:hypothetical protein